MTRSRCPVTQSAIARALRAAKQERARAVRVDPDGTIWIEPNVANGENPQLVKERVAGDHEAVL